MKNQTEIVEAIEELTETVANLNSGLVYGDNLVDTLGDIAFSLRIMSKRTTLDEKGREVWSRIKEKV